MESEDEERKHTNQTGFKDAQNVDEVLDPPTVPFTVCSFRAEFCFCPVLSIHLENNTLCVKCFRARQSDGSFKGIFFPLGSNCHYVNRAHSVLLHQLIKKQGTSIYVYMLIQQW